VRLSDAPPPIDSSSAVSYAFSALPTKLWKKYQYAEKFVRLVKMKTPKVTYYSDRTKFSLMENDPADFEAVFYDGSKISLSSNTYKLIDSNGTNIKFNDDESSKVLSTPQLDLFQHAKECHSHCKELENAVEKLSTLNSLDEGRTAASYFPLIIGRRPSTSTVTSANEKPSKPPEIKGYVRDVKNATVSSPSAPVSVSVMSYDGTLLSDIKQTTPLRATKMSQPALPSRPKGPVRASSTSSLDRISEEKKTVDGGRSISVKECFMQGVGWASQLKSGEIQIQYNDGSQMKFHPTLLVVHHTNATGETNRYSKTDALPSHVKTKLAQLPNAIEELSEK